MARKRPESFAIALDWLRADLRAGTHPAGARLTAGAIAERLQLSPTPVREALSRLAGEGLLDDRRGQGYFTPQLGARDIEQLFRLQLELLGIACANAQARPPAALERLEHALSQARPSERPQLGSERLFRFLAATGSHTLTRHLRRLQDQLAPARRAEPQVLTQLDAELAQLFDAARTDRPGELKTALEAFHVRRINAAETLAQLSGASGKYRIDIS